MKLLTAVLLACLIGCGEPPRLELLPAGSTVLAFGDSVTYGTGAKPGQDWPTLIGQASSWQVINAGIPGDTARQARSRLAPLLQEHQPALVIVELGGNDFLRKSQPSKVKEYLRDILTQSQASGAITVMIAVPRLSLLRASAGALKDSELYAELAEETGVLLIEDVFSKVLSDDSLRADQVHPNAQGYRQMAQGILQALASAGLIETGLK